MRVETCLWNGSWSTPLPSIAPTVVLCFGDPGLRSADPAGPLADLHRAYPDAVHAGCSSSGEILGDDVLEGTLAAVIVTFDAVTARGTTHTISDPEQSHAVGQALAKDLAADASSGPLKHVFLLSDGLGVNGSALAAGVQSALDSEVVVTGGLAGDGPRFERTWVFDGDSPRAGVIRAVGLYGDALVVGHGSRGGWSPFGVVRTVTRAEGNVLYELDGRPALDLYREYLGDRAAGLPATGLLFPLAVTDEHRTDIVRTILAIDDDARSLTFAGDVPVGAKVRLMRADNPALIDAAGEAAQAARVTESPVLGLAVSCVGRRLVLGESSEEEVEEALEHLPEGSWLAGFYSYGELSPASGTSCLLHNQTMTLTTWGES